MARMNIIAAACMLLVVFLGLVNASPAAAKEHDAPGPKKKYVPMGDRLDCPGAGGSKYTGPRGGKWGILCGWDTVSVTHQWGPFDLPFDQCIAKCGGMEGCFLATHNGMCYLKKRVRKQGYIRTKRPDNKTAIKLSDKADSNVRVYH